MAQVASGHADLLGGPMLPDLAATKVIPAACEEDRAVLGADRRMKGSFVDLPGCARAQGCISEWQQRLRKEQEKLRSSGKQGERKAT